MRDGTRRDGGTRSVAAGKLDALPPAINSLTERVIGAAIEVHRHLGPGLLERLYVQALCHELDQGGVAYAAEVPITVRYKDTSLQGQRLDLVVSDTVVVEAKAIERVHDVHLAQLVSYIRSGGYPAGLLINFNVPLLRDGIYRRINVIQPPCPSAPSAFHPDGTAE